MKTIEEKNKIIAEFMGYKTYEHTNSTAIRLLEENEFNSIDIGHIHTKFHTSWDWLMPVVDKIYNLPQESEDNNLIGDITNALVDIDILECHEAVVNFIEELKNK
jgi:hypothetical protein